MQVVVIGGTGHIGSYLTPQLVRAGHHVICVCRRRRQPYVADEAWERVEFREIDRDIAERDGVFGREITALDAEIVVDLTCYTPESARQLTGELRGRVRHFLHCGTIWIHGPSVEVPTTEEVERAPFGEYGIRKAEIERYLLREAADGFPVTLLHPGHLVGPGWNPVNPAGNFNVEAFARLAAGDELAIPNIGMETVHHVHASDVAGAFVNAIAHRDAALGQSFHVVSAAALTLRGYAIQMAEWFGKEANLKFVPWDEWKASVSTRDAEVTWDHILHSPNCSIEKARRLIGYAPRYSSLDAVKESVRWLIENGKIAR